MFSSHGRALTIAREATTARIEALERFAVQVLSADDARRDWKRTMEVSDFNDEKYRELVARAAADDIAIVEVAGMTEQAAAAQVFNDSLHEASLAAEALALL
jgi:hypothetical protein